MKTTFIFMTYVLKNLFPKQTNNLANPAIGSIMFLLARFRKVATEVL